MDGAQFAKMLSDKYLFELNRMGIQVLDCQRQRICRIAAAKLCAASAVD